MKPSWLRWSLLSLLVAPALGTPSDASPDQESGDALVKRGGRGVDPDTPTTFNDIEVPPLTQLTPENFEEVTKDGYWMIKHYSPTCPHCRTAAPMYQTLYEYYYTSNPLFLSGLKPGELASLDSFTGYYNLRFGSINCLAFGDFCTKLNVEFFPAWAFYDMGVQNGRPVGAKTMSEIAAMIEVKLETIKPGSRPSQGVQIPKAGAKSMEMTAKPEVVKPGAKTAVEKQSIETAELEGVSPESVKAKLQGRPANPQGISIPLTAESFQSLVTTTHDPWIIKFYVPWCHHCQALAPNWNSMAKEMKDTLNVGEVNCDIERRLCEDARVNAYPTIYFFRGGERVEYTGLRGLGDLIAYTNKAVGVGSSIQDVDATTFKQLEETEEVLFLYLYDHATTSEDFEAMNRLTLSLVGHARIVKSDSAALSERFKISTWPRLLVVRDGRPNYYNALAPKDMRDFRQILSWMQTVWLPIVPELTASNAQEIMNGKFVVLGLLSRRRSDDFKQSKRELKEAALEWMDKQVQLFRLERAELRDSKQLRIEEADDRNDQRALRAAKNMRITIREDDKKQVAFAWVDGDFWERWLRTTYGIDVENSDRVIINDQDNRRYWDTASSGAPIMASRTSILETIPLVIASPSKLSPKSTIGTFETILFFTRSLLGSHPILFFVVLGAVVAVATIFGRGRLRRGAARGGIIGNTNNNGGFFHLDGKEGFLNGGSTDKVD
ncbi:unnamed protein product [Penicillium nalgiovense]|uniref:Thioredoxin domain-containing protein n=1 Tax=Penicillium nalgiovense TaxID=60175 RepID=A0A1V6Y2P7_PENNA|nr:hypothetical protein PENNAL_c0039G03159 [Penicillium nalgiovense]CAG7956443.1 unnamed protein product [Penicillium nalgiovense]CAG7995554.1 unnamed protein product [Penicillium nalgiovense]CAG8043518.1 unnamed protein product [Penicillium nalgiovense]CAG8050772.1 unnamed protein product [Penicillium nalgiovense]